MKGQISERPLAELVREISSKDLSGTLRLQHESVKTAFYFDNGEIIYAASNLRELRLAEYLKKQGFVSAQELSAAGNRSDATLAAALVSKGVIDQQTIESLFTRQVGDILRVALLWSEGTWEFDDCSLLADSIRVKLDTSGLLMEAARRMQLELIASRFPFDQELISPATSVPDFKGLLPAEGFVISRLETPMKLSELIALSGMGELEATRTIYGLVLGGFMERERSPSVLQARQRAAVSHTRTALPAQESLPTPGEASEETQIADLDAFLARLDGAGNHYEVLNLISSAPPERIKNSYYALARLYHPDKFHLQTSTTLHSRIESAFARITQAYETLMDPRRRSGYDAKLAALEKSRKFAQSAPKKVVKEAGATSASDAGTAPLAGSESERAENNFEEGYAALQQGQAKFAVTRLAAAARAVPQEARYRAYYGSALAAGQDTRRLAEAELQAAIKLDPDNASYRIMLAELFFDLGFVKRAESELERAVSLEPNNPAARKLMNRLETNRAAR